MRKLILIGASALAAVGAWADAVDDVRDGTDVHFDLRGSNYTYSGASSGSGTIADADAPATCVPKSASTLNFSLDTAALGMPFSVIINMVGTKISPTRVRWTTDTALNQCVSVDINGTSTNILLKRVRGQLTLNAGSLEPFFDLTCGRGFNVGLDDTNSDTDSWMDVESYAFCIQSAFTRIDFRARALDAISFAGLPKGNLRATGYEIVDGFELSGGLSDLHVSDNNYLVAFNGEDLASVVDIFTTAPQTGLGTVQFTLESSVARPGLSYAFSLYNNSTSTFQVLSGGTAPTSDVTVTIGPTSGGGTYINGTTREIRSRIVWQPINDEDPGQDGWAHQMDLARFYVSP